MRCLKKSIYSMIVLIALVYGCSTTGPKTLPTVHIRQDIDFSYIKRIAVLPFQNYSGDRNAGNIIRDMVINEFLASGLVDVVYSGDVNTILEKYLKRRRSPEISTKIIRKIAKALKVQAVVTGSVSKFEIGRFGNVSAPEVTINITMADAESGSIIWSVTVTKTGADFWARHFGGRTESLSETALKAVREAIATLYEE